MGLSCATEEQQIDYVRAKSVFNFEYFYFSIFSNFFKDLSNFEEWSSEEEL